MDITWKASWVPSTEIFESLNVELTGKINTAKTLPGTQNFIASFAFEYGPVASYTIYNQSILHC